MAKHPATQLNTFIERLAIWLKNNQPAFVESYNVTASSQQSDADYDISKLRFNITFNVSNSKIKELHMTDMIEQEME